MSEKLILRVIQDRLTRWGCLISTLSLPRWEGIGEGNSDFWDNPYHKINAIGGVKDERIHLFSMRVYLRSGGGRSGFRHQTGNGIQGPSRRLDLPAVRRGKGPVRTVRGLVASGRHRL